MSLHEADALMIHIVAVEASEEDRRAEVVTAVHWRDVTTGATGVSDAATMLRWIENDNGDARIHTGTTEVMVGVDRTGTPRLRSYTDGAWTDDLQRLPRHPPGTAYSELP